MVTNVNEQFGTHPDLKKLYYTYLAIVTIVFLAWILPVTATAFIFFPFNSALIVAASLLVPLFFAIVFVGYWINQYYASISYSLTDNEIVVHKGVWWKKKSFVPYNRITNVNIEQGPISRHFQLGTVLIQTAGFSGGTSSARGLRPAEAVILGVKNFKEIKDKVMNFVRRVRPVAVEAQAETMVSEDFNRQILAELKKISKALEKTK
ncbi:MAG: Bacterial membrane flanked domain protein [Candidatus Bathyarchaeota archaeon BA2]|nr:MAG: Bacterial membrane flanked domain protein [Candidatus Bathyarchaeota archaeon BA2]